MTTELTATTTSRPYVQHLYNLISYYLLISTQMEPLEASIVQIEPLESRTDEAVERVELYFCEMSNYFMWGVIIQLPVSPSLISVMFWPLYRFCLGILCQYPVSKSDQADFKRGDSSLP